MKLRILFLALAAASLTVLCSGLARPQKRNPGYTIAEIQAKLYYSNSGRFSANVIGNRKIVLWNVVIGEGTVDGPSENTLFTVRVQGPPRGAPHGLKLRMVAWTEQDTLEDREIEVGLMNTAGNFYAACLLYETGCLPVTVEARLTMGRESQRRSAEIAFECGE